MKTLKSIWDWYINGGIFFAALDANTGEERNVRLPFKLIIPFILAIVVAVLAIVFNSLTVGIISVALWAVFFITYIEGRSPKEAKKDAGTSDSN